MKKIVKYIVIIALFIPFLNLKRWETLDGDKFIYIPRTHLVNNFNNTHTK